MACHSRDERASREPVLVGRDEQMAALDAASLACAEGGPTAVLLGGEAGVGKSRLVSESGEAEEAAGACVLPRLPGTGHRRTSVCALYRGAAQHGDEFGADAVASMLPSRITRGLARLLPELGKAAPARFGADPDEARARLFEEVLAPWVGWPRAGRLSW